MRLAVPRYLRPVLLSLAGVGLLLFLGRPAATQPKDDKGAVGKTSYDQVSPALQGQVSFTEMMEKDKAAKPDTPVTITRIYRNIKDIKKQPPQKVDH